MRTNEASKHANDEAGNEPNDDPDSTPGDTVDISEDDIAAALTAERTHLAESRAALHRMRERTQSLQARGGDPLSTEFIKAALWRRVRALEDDPDIPLFFGRLDYSPESPYPDERFYVGRRHVTDDAGDPMVVDWRAPVSQAFYRATRVDPMGLRLRRRFGFHHGDLTAVEDEPLAVDRGSTTQGASRASRILEQEIERPRTGPMRDIVATIQPEQDEIVRAPLDLTVCVQGAPGTGKTAVGLHRVAYLLYAYRDQLVRQGVLVIGPNASFLRYIADVLPALGEIDAKHVTLDDLVSDTSRPGTLAGTDLPEVALLKGDARMAEVLHRAVWAHLRKPRGTLVVPSGSRTWRIPPYELEEIVQELRNRGVRYNAGRAMLPQRLAHAVLLRMEAAGQAPDDRVQDAVARSRPVRQCVAEMWPALDPARLVFRLLSDPEFLAGSAAGLLDEREQDLLIWPRPAKSARSARWSTADATLLDEVADLLDRTPSVRHLVLDEAQDLSPMQFRAVARRCTTGSLTVLGDLAQATTPWAAHSWDEALAHLDRTDAAIEELTRGFRVPADVIAFAARLLPSIAPSLERPSSVRRSRGDLAVRRVEDGLSAAIPAVHEALSRQGSVGLIVSDAAVPPAAKLLDAERLAYSRLGDEDDVEARLDLVPARLAKGLEFDHVVVVEPADIVAAEPDEITGLRRLYVCLTRAVTSLAVLHAQDLPTALRS